MKLLVITIILFTAVSSAAFSEGYDRSGKYAPADSKTAQVYDNETMTLYSIPEDRVQYYVTKPSHPAYPYMVKSKVLGRGNDTRFRAIGYGEADNDEAAAFLKEIEEINAERMRKIRGEN